MTCPDPAAELARLITELAQLEAEVHTINPRDSEAYDVQLEKVRELGERVRKLRDQHEPRKSS
jgi:hypothetical protein